MRQTGLINIIRTTSDTSRSNSGGSLLGALVALAGVVLLGAGVYRALDAGIRGIAASTAEANRIVGWAAATVLVLGALTAAGWVLLARRRALRDGPVVEAFTAATDRALEAHRQGRLPASLRAERRELHHVAAVRLDRLDADRSQP
ncbi:hypothetical protein EV188_102512 [Actinomycetospora succinea]|uniref:Uncharacterized protein n=1 Tax=Actinomycetospora succinea TaxID=663603 RepID=A0A4R6VJ49_9PSEU|nr:hypothetical protein [Actinomycetospora succinea]TDQ62856.1 hypothetical protein EV188_102512 [Actinomycetospora succinea]